MFKSGGNVQRENHLNKKGKSGGGMGSAGGGMKPGKSLDVDSPDGGGSGGGSGGSGSPEIGHEASETEGTTTMHHMAGGKVNVEHADGETSEHPSMGHAMMAIHAKHEVGPAMHVHNHGGAPMQEHEGMEPHHTVTTHHVGHEGTVEGPHHHESMDATAEHMKGSIGDGGGMKPGGGGHEMAMGGGSERAPLY